MPQHPALVEGRAAVITCGLIRAWHAPALSDAELLICPDNTIPIKRWRHPCCRSDHQGYRRLGFLGTRWLVPPFFSKKAENHAHSVAIHFMHYNFVRIHQSLRITPAMAAGVTSKLWSLTDMLRVIEDWEAARSLKISGETMVG